MHTYIHTYKYNTIIQIDTIKKIKFENISLVYDIVGENL